MVVAASAKGKASPDLAREAAAFPATAASEVFSAEELFSIIAQYAYRSHPERPLNLQRVCKSMARVVTPLTDPIAALVGAKRVKKQYQSRNYIQSQLEGLLYLAPAELKLYGYQTREISYSGYAYHLFCGSLLPRMIGDHGGLDALEARRDIKLARSTKLRENKKRKLNTTQAELDAQQQQANAKHDEVGAKRLKARDARLDALTAVITAKDLPFDGAADAKSFCEATGALGPLEPFFADRVSTSVSMRAVISALAAVAPIAQAARELHTNATRAAFLDVCEAQSLRGLRVLVARAKGGAGANTSDALRTEAVAELGRLQAVAGVVRELDGAAAIAAYPHVGEVRSRERVQHLVCWMAARMPAAAAATADTLRAAVGAELQRLQDSSQAADEARAARILKCSRDETFSTPVKVHAACRGVAHCRQNPSSACEHGMCGTCCAGCMRHSKGLNGLRR
ncbi:hypothetical protein T492DRAFT_1014668 [Pavlovales sp. CCMP2436]|nr:hypothetical protein T492DRAFT_1014668 [Pavlovales sp. CCMP2436]|mmetsp:Transcript_6811/g.17857  ORF Transcript_6811/g.17857 Transcript_6811/m.17857 type:complete len:455 (-) Transcript_6811:183-1547(-)